MATATAPRGAPACVAQRRASERGGGAPARVGETRGRRWLRQRWPVATAALDRERERGGRENGHGREQERCGAARGVVRAIQATRGEAGGGAHARGRRARAPVLLARGRGRLALASQLGRPAGPGQAAQCQAAGKLPFSYFFFFSNF